MHFYLTAETEDTLDMSWILVKLLIRQLSRLLWISRRTGPSDLVRDWICGQLGTSACEEWVCWI